MNINMNKNMISIVIPLHNEQEVIPILFSRLTNIMDPLSDPYEIILVNDGSSDLTELKLAECYQKRPDVLRIINLNTNYGQHMAIMAGFGQVVGDIVVTLDADLQNPPEEIPKLIKKIKEGHDVVGGIRQDRQDHKWRLWVSKLHNKIRAFLAPQLAMEDEGCMLRAFKINIVKQMLASGESCIFIPALALTYAVNPAEVPVKHESRAAGTSNYNLYKLIRYNFDLVTGFSVVPLQLFTVFGIFLSFMSGLLVAYMVFRRIFIGPEAEGMFTLFAILLFLVSMSLFGIGLLGEYVGRIYLEVRRRPRYIIKNVLKNTTIPSREHHD